MTKAASGEYPPKRNRGRPLTDGREPSGIGSVEIAMDVLGAFLDHGGELSLTELSTITGMAASKLHRYLVSFGRRGMVRRSEVTGLYDLGPAARTLGAVALARFDGFDTIDDAIKSLSRRLACTVFSYVASESGPVLVRSYSTKPSVLVVRVGSSLPLLHSGCGPVFLACQPRAWCEPVLANELKGGSPAEWDAAWALRERVRTELDQTGAYWADRGVFANSAVCAAPVFDLEGHLVTVLGVAVLGHDEAMAPRSVVVPALTATTSELSAAFGYRGTISQAI